LDTILLALVKSLDIVWRQALCIDAIDEVGITSILIHVGTARQGTVGGNVVLESGGNSGGVAVCTGRNDGGKSSEGDCGSNSAEVAWLVESGRGGGDWGSGGVRNGEWSSGGIRTSDWGSSGVLHSDWGSGGQMLVEDGAGNMVFSGIGGAGIGFGAKDALYVVFFGC